MSVSRTWQVFFMLALVILAMEASAMAQSESVLFSFPGGDLGSVPTPGITFHNGNLFGATEEGGAFGISGILFELSSDGMGDWSEDVLHVFQGKNDGSNPPAPMVFDSAGNFYGAAASHGKNLCGLIFEFSPVGNNQWKARDLYDFTCGTDGSGPRSVTIDASGNLYGVTASGGDLSACGTGCGVVFQLSPTLQGQWTETVLHTFTGGIDGWSPSGGLTFDSNGNLYGATAYGGNSDGTGLGVVFELSPQGGGQWNNRVLHFFPGGADGQLPFGNLVLNGGRIYGTTWQGGLMQTCNGVGCGVAYELTPQGNTWRYTCLHRFTGGTDGGNLFGPLTRLAGKLYGTAQVGGILTLCRGVGGSQGNGCGVVYELSPNLGGGWTDRIVYAFQGGSNDGDGPYGLLAPDQSGNLYGVTRIGGTAGLGVVFTVKPH